MSDAKDICNLALSKISAEPITGFDDGSVEAGIVRPIYEQVKRGLLGRHNWNFARTKRQLARLPDDPAVSDWKYRYQAPADYIKNISAGDNGYSQGADFELIDGEFHTDLPTFLLQFIRNASERDMPPHFVDVLRMQLEAEFVMPLGSESVNEYNMRAQMAKDQLTIAKAMDGTENSAETLDPGSELISCRG